MKKTVLLLFACLSLGLVATGCGGEDEDGGGGAGAGQPAQTEEQEATQGGGAAKAQVEVGMQDIAFVPEKVTVKKGGTITWTNNESAPHDVTKMDGPGPDFSSGNGNMQEGDTYEQTFNTPGEIRYVCTVHPGMEGTITVK